MDKVTLIMDNLNSSVEIQKDSECTEYLQAFCGLLSANSFLTCTIIKALRKTLQCYEEDIKLCTKKDSNMEYLS